MLIIFLIVCLAILALCVYKIYEWYKQPENQQLFQEIEEHRAQIPPLITRITRIRNRIAGALGIVIAGCLIFSMLMPFSMKMAVRELLGYILLGIMFVAIISGNMVTYKLWRCPSCSKRLPVRVSKGGKRPAIIYTCPHCGHKL